MRALTDYVAAFHLTTLVHAAHPLWLGGGGHGSGMALFVSALDAEIYRHALIAAQGNPGWRRVPLAHFDLKKIIKSHGGRFDGCIVFGFIATPSGQLAARRGLLRTRVTPLWSDPNPDSEEAPGFNFPESSFEFIREEWANIGAEGHAEEVDAANLEKDSRVMTMARLALERTSPIESSGPGECWSVYSQRAGKWHFGPTAPIGSFSLSGSGVSETLDNPL